MWWRPGGYFSAPLLANPQFRKIFLARTKEILDRVYTKENFFPLIDEMADRLREDVILRAKLRGEDAASGTRVLARNVELFKTHLLKRRQFLLEQKELRTLGKDGDPDAARPNTAPGTRRGGNERGLSGRQSHYPLTFRTNIARGT